MMTKLTDTQSLLLATAAQRNTLSLYPLPATLKPGGGLTKALDTLVTHGLIEERETDDKPATTREDGDLRYGLFATPAGLAAIGLGPQGDDAGSDDTAADMATPTVPTIAPAPLTKSAQVLTLLLRPEGATLDQLVDATGWLPHTTRAALTGLRKKGHDVTSEKTNGTRVYRVMAVATAAAAWADANTSVAATA